METIGIKDVIFVAMDSARLLIRAVTGFIVTIPLIEH